MPIQQPDDRLRHTLVTTATGLLAVAATLAWWMGADASGLFVDARAMGSEPWRLLTSALLHTDVLHLGFNLYWLWVLGSRIELVWGGLRTLGLYAGLAAVSSTAEYALYEGGVGLSGVGYGLFGLVWVLGRHDSRLRGVVTPTVAVLFVGWFFLCVVATATGTINVANVAHAAGAAAGALTGLVLIRPGASRRTWEAVSAIALIGLVALATVLRPVVNLGAGGAAVAALGLEALEQGDPESALQHFEQALEEYGEDPRWIYDQGIALEELGRHAEALERYERALALEPDDRTYRETVGTRSAYAAWVALDDGRNADAMHLYERALELVELEPEHWHNYGVALDRLERPDDAAAAYAKARELGLRP